MKANLAFYFNLDVKPYFHMWGSRFNAGCESIYLIWFYPNSHNILSVQLGLFVLLKLTSLFNTGYSNVFIGFHFFWSSCLVFPLGKEKQCISLKWLWTDMKKYIYSLKHFLHGFSCFFFIIQCHFESFGASNHSSIMEF